MSPSAAALQISLIEEAPAVTAVERIDGRARLVLQSPTRAIRVRSGRANLFIELLDATGASTGLRRCLATLSAGDAMVLPPEMPEGQCVFAAGIGPAEIELIDRIERLTLEPASVEPVLRTLLSGLGSREPSEANWTIAPGSTLAAASAGFVMARSLTWVEITTADSIRCKPRPRPIFNTHAIAIEAGNTVTALTTADTIAIHGWIVIEDCMTELLSRFGEALSVAARVREQRARQRLQRQHQIVGTALAELPALMDGRRTEGARRAGACSPAVRALDILCKAEGIEVELPASSQEENDAPGDLLQALRLSGLRWRRIRLHENWWRQDGANFIGFNEEGHPYAVIRRGPARFELVDPETLDRRSAGSKEAAQLRPFGYVIFRPLPWRRLNAWDLVRHVLATPARTDMQWAIALALLSSVIGLLTPVITGTILNEVVPFAETDRLFHLSLGLVMVALGSALFQVVRTIALLRVETFADGSLQAAIWDRLLRLPLTFYRRYQVGELMVKAMAPTQLRQHVSDTAINSGLAAVFSLVNFAIMLFYDQSLALVAFAFTCASMLLLFGLTWWQLRYERALVKADAAVSGFILQILFGIEKIRLAGAESRAYSRWLASFADQRLQRYRAANVANVTTTVNGALPVLASLLFFAVIGFGNRSIPIGDFAAFAVAFGQFQAAMLGLVGALSLSLAAVPIYENMKPILEEQPEVDTVRQNPGTLRGRIELRHVSFRYHPEAPLALDRLDLVIEPGEFVALVGPSGSGKSTIFRLLLGFETPESGSILYDDRDLAHLDLKAVRRQLGVVLQRGTLLPGSIHENIVGSQPLPEAAAWEAARMAGLDEDIRAMPMGMHTVLSEGGGALSGGQRQRLMIARAIVRTPRLLLMDEATSALDNRTQTIVSENLSRMNATRVVIAHRLSTIRHADRILVVDAGRIVQTGTYDELLEQPGLFREIASRQIA